MSGNQAELLNQSDVGESNAQIAWAAEARMLHRFNRSSVLATLLACAGLAGLLPLLAAQAKQLNGFELKGASVPQRQILKGGPPRDGIPAIDKPRFIEAQDAHWLLPQARVLGVQRGGEARAYPIEILNWHELVNDQFGDEGVLISYCPLCGTGMAFRSEINDQRLTFGVSGLLYNSDVLFYDRETESLWSQIKRQAISGDYLGADLTQLPLSHVNWGQWRRAHPQTLVLSREQGFARDYSADPYAGYEQSRRLYFKVGARIPREFHPKERVLGLVDGEQALALPYSILRAQALTQFQLEFAGAPVTIVWDEAAETATALDAAGAVRVHTIAFWFAWYAFHPQTEVFRGAASVDE
ncbi:MAG: DUF3179 domain-containing protein [Pseudomonadales bacterium]